MGVPKTLEDIANDVYDATNKGVILGAGANAIGKLATNTGVDIGDVDVTSISAGTNVIGQVGLVDGVTSTIKATVLDYTNSNPLAVRLTDASGDYTAAGGGTQYAVDTALGNTPTGTAAIAKRDDALSTLTPVEGDAVEIRVDANGALWTHDDALDAALAGSEIQVDVVAALPAGTNAIGKLAANSGVDIGDVDVTSISAGTNVIGQVGLVDGVTSTIKATVLDYTNSNPLAVRLTDASGDYTAAGGGTQYAVDTALGNTPTGTAAIAKRDDALSTLTPVEGDAVEIRVDANGALWTHDDALDAALAGSEIQVDVVAALPAGTNAIGKLAANSGVDIGDVDVTSISAGTNVIGKVGHDKTGIGHGVKTVTTAGSDEALAASTTAKVVILQAQTDNTSAVAIGATGVDATVATGNGILLYAGDSMTLEIDNLADVFVDALVAGEGVRYTYLT